MDLSIPQDDSGTRRDATDGTPSASALLADMSAGAPSELLAAGASEMTEGVASMVVDGGYVLLRY